MSTLKKRTRLAAVATATLSGASIFALAAPAHAAAVAPDVVPAVNSKAIGGTNKITVTWDEAPGGEPATSYVVVVYSHNPANPPTYLGVPVATEVTLTTSAVIEDLEAGLYQVLIFANNAYGSSAGRQPVNYVWADGITVSDPAVVTPEDKAKNYKAYRPYTNWEDMITQEYKLYTGFDRSGTAVVNGREPRLDELTFWKHFIANAAFSDQEWTNYSWYYDARYAYLTTDPDGVNPPGVLFAPADTNKDGALSAEELDAADLLAEDWAYNDVLFDRREVFAAWLAEEAEQTDGPAYRLYTAYFGGEQSDGTTRTADWGGLSFWSTRLRTGGNLLGVSEFFLDSDEFIERYGEYETYAPEGPKTDAAEFVALIYRNVLDRTPDGSGFSFWTRQLQTERYTPAEVLIGFSESHEFKDRMHRRVTAAVNYAHLLGRVPTDAEYVLHEFYGEDFWDNPNEPTQFWIWDPILGEWVPFVDGYELIIDSSEYAARAEA